MDNSIAGIIGVILVILIAEGVGICLRRPLSVLLRAEKGAERSEFWSAYIRVVLLLVPGAFALLCFPSVLDQLRWGLAGLLIALAVAGKALRVPPPARPHTAPYIPPIIPPASPGTAR